MATVCSGHSMEFYNICIKLAVAFDFTLTSQLHIDVSSSSNYSIFWWFMAEKFPLSSFIPLSLLFIKLLVLFLCLCDIFQNQNAQGCPMGTFSLN